MKAAVREALIAKISAAFASLALRKPLPRDARTLRETLVAQLDDGSLTLDTLMQSFEAYCTAAVIDAAMSEVQLTADLDRVRERLASRRARQ